MKEAKIDIAVLLIFFTRDQQLGKVFEQVKMARPTRLYLYQDGARANREDDVERIKKCREIVADENIDWQCEVHRFYQEKNYGCDPSGYIAQKWMFQSEEYGIVLEDDVVPSQSFFPFCKELLEKYKDNEKINTICGMNNTGVSEHIKESYLFTQKGSIWGWASWKRVIDTWDGEYRWTEDEEKRNTIKRNMKAYSFDDWYQIVLQHKASGRAHHESIHAASMFLYDRVNIVPKYNMISNIGVDQESTHSVSDIRLLPKRTQKLLFMKTYEIEFPLIHPSHIVIDRTFEKKMTVGRIESVFMTIEILCRSFIFLGFKGTMNRIVKKVMKRVK